MNTCYLYGIPCWRHGWLLGPMGDFGKDSGLGGCPQLEALSLGQQPREERIIERMREKMCMAAGRKRLSLRFCSILCLRYDLKSYLGSQRNLDHIGVGKLIQNQHKNFQKGGHLLFMGTSSGTTDHSRYARLWWLKHSSMELHECSGAEWICEASHIHVLLPAIHISWEALRITALLESVFSVSFALKEGMYSSYSIRA